MSIQAFGPPFYWYNLWSNNDGSLCKLLLLEECIFVSILLTCGLIRQQVVSGEMTTIVMYDKLKIFIAEYELVSVELINQKLVY